MSLQKLPPVTFKNTIQKQQISQRMYYHRKRLYELNTKKSKQPQSEANIQTYKTLFEQNPKRNSIIQNKYTQIERQNRILFQKITRISKNKKRSNDGMERMRSLNITARKRQIEDIENENVKMFGRILKQKPFISFKETDRDFVRTKKISDRISMKGKYKLEDWY